MRGPRGLKRVAALYAMVERVRAVELRAAALAVDEADEALRELAQARGIEASAARAGLERGSRVETLSMEQVRASEQGLSIRLVGLRAERAGLYERALAAHRESGTELEQLRRLLAREAELVRVTEERREQAAADDRFLSRLRVPGRTDLT